MLDGTVLKKYKMRTKLSTVMKFRKSSTYNSKDIMSFERKNYKFFCLARPFYIKPMRVSDRETCKCIIHANMEYIVQSLYVNNIVFGKTLNDIIKDICCSTYAEDCLLRKCENCKNAKPHFKEYNGRIACNISSGKIAKQPNDVEAAELVTIFMSKLPILLSHEGRVLHQHHSISELKKLKANEIIVHCDFSENYSMKYAEEIQPSILELLHFVRIVKSWASSYLGPSSPYPNKLYPKWNQYHPLFERQPATQYRNKEMFCFITNHFKKHFPEVKNCHGITMRQAMAKELRMELVAFVRGPLIELCHKERTFLIWKLFSLAFKGTLKVHQVLPVKNKLYLRSLSCFTCRDFCNHFDLGSLAYENSFTSSESNEDSEEE
nr:unnamed protein product [Callosobruchus analis]